ncbi:MAG: peptidoglycan binding domain-containing protein, partial [Clostridiales bacterium]|nr:peptidoglycan binding domain-containing protein [Clostridiales bacterium]
MPKQSNFDNKNTKQAKGKSGKKHRKSKVGLLIAISVICMAAAVAISLSSIKTLDTYSANNDPVVEEGSDNLEMVDTSVLDEGTVIYDNIHINGIDVSGLTPDEAMDALSALSNKAVSDISNNEITLAYADKTFNYTMLDLGVWYDFDAAVNIAYEYGKTGSKNEREKKVNALSGKPLELEAEMVVDNDKLNSVLVDISTQIDKAPVNAEIVRGEGGFVTTKEEDGLELNLETSMADIVKFLKLNTTGLVDLTVDVKKAEYTAEDLEHSTQLIGTYYTNVASAANRNENLYNAASKIDGWVVYPGEVFSTNKAFGEMTYDNGYR